MSAPLSVQMLDDDVQPVAWLFEHDDGRQRVAFGDGSPAFTHGNPAWHRVGPVEVDPMPANPASVQSFLDLACLYCAVTDTPLGDVKWTFAQGDMENLAAEIVRQNQRIRDAAPVAPVPEPSELHAKIMNIQASEKVKAELEGAPKGFYLLGHRDARHAAAELVLATQAAPVDTKPAEAA